MHNTLVVYIWSMPRGWVMNSFGQLTSCTLCFDPLGVQREWSTLLLEFDFRAPDCSLSLLWVHEALSVVCVCAWWRLIVLHDTTWCEELVEQVWSQWDCDSNRHVTSRTCVHVPSHADPLVSDCNGFLEIFHALCRGHFTAFTRVESVHYLLLFIINYSESNNISFQFSKLYRFIYWTAFF